MRLRISTLLEDILLVVVMIAMSMLVYIAFAGVERYLATGEVNAPLLELPKNVKNTVKVE